MNAISQQWINETGTFYPVSGDTRLLTSPGDGVFVVVESATPMMKRIGLKRIGNKFDFDFKLYELGTDPIIRLMRFISLKNRNHESFYVIVSRPIWSVLCAHG